MCCNPFSDAVFRFELCDLRLLERETAAEALHERIVPPLPKLRPASLRRSRAFQGDRQAVQSNTERFAPTRSRDIDQES